MWFKYNCKQIMNGLFAMTYIYKSEGIRTVKHTQEHTHQLHISLSPLSDVRNELIQNHIYHIVKIIYEGFIYTHLILSSFDILYSSFYCCCRPLADEKFKSGFKKKSFSLYTSSHNTQFTHSCVTLIQYEWGYKDHRALIHKISFKLSLSSKALFNGSMERQRKIQQCLIQINVHIS